jgi:hypothetical protein
MSGSVVTVLLLDLMQKDSIDPVGFWPKAVPELSPLIFGCRLIATVLFNLDWLKSQDIDIVVVYETPNHDHKKKKDVHC